MKKVPYTMVQINKIWTTEYPILLENLNAALDIKVKDYTTQMDKIGKINQILDRMKEIANMMPSDLYRDDMPEGMVKEEVSPGQFVYRSMSGIPDMWPDLSVWPELSESRTGVRLLTTREIPLTNEQLIALAADNPPPDEWFEGEEEPLFEKHQMTEAMKTALKEFFACPNWQNRIGPWNDVRNALNNLHAVYVKEQAEEEKEKPNK